MTAIYYPDCQATSPNGRFTLKARSPDNARARGGLGRGSFQNNFTYQLIDNTSRKTLWKRPQPEAEESPSEVLVSDAGWSIVRTHGFMPEVIAADPAGKVMARVRVLSPKDQEDDSERAPNYSLNCLTWHARHLACTTAGYYWAGNSWRYFLDYDGRPLFVWRAWWGQRLMIDLEPGELITEGWQSEPALVKAVVAEESRGVRALLASLAARMTEVQKLLKAKSVSDKHPLLPTIRLARAAIHLAGVHGLRDCVPHLREWELVESQGYSTSCAALGGDAWLEAQRYRGLVQHSLRKLNEEPAGHAVYHFGYREGMRLAVPECLADRSQRAAQLHQEMSAPEVLALLGAPDHIGRTSLPDGDRFLWVETWEYDLRIGASWQTLTLMWEKSETNVRLVKIEQAALTPQQVERRESELLWSW